MLKYICYLIICKDISTKEKEPKDQKSNNEKSLKSYPKISLIPLNIIT